MFTCVQCHESFPKSRDLESHARARKHKSYLCSQCTKGFTSRPAHWKHEQTHSKPRSFPCMFCEQTLSRKEHLKKHVKKYHINTEVTTQTRSRRTVIDLTNEAGPSTFNVANPDHETPGTLLPAPDSHAQPQFPSPTWHVSEGSRGYGKNSIAVPQLLAHNEEAHAEADQRCADDVTDSTSEGCMQSHRSPKQSGSPSDVFSTSMSSDQHSVCSDQLSVSSVVGYVSNSISTPFKRHSTPELETSAVSNGDYHSDEKTSNNRKIRKIKDEGSTTYKLNHKTGCYERMFWGVTDIFIFGGEADLSAARNRMPGISVRVMRKPKITSWIPNRPSYGSKDGEAKLFYFRVVAPMDLNLLEDRRYWFKVGDWESGPRLLERSTDPFIGDYEFEVSFGIPRSAYPKEGTKIPVFERTSWNMEWKQSDIIAHFDSEALGGLHYGVVWSPW